MPALPDPAPAPRLSSAGAVTGPLRVSLHGAAWLQAPGREAVRLERKQAALLAWLSLAGPSPRAKLAGLLWPDASADGARNNLRQCLSRLRRLAPSLLSGGELLSLAPEVVVGTGTPAGPALLEAHDYADCEEFARWLQAQTDDERARRRQVLLAGVRAATERGDLAQAEAEAGALLAHDRESEDSYRALMEVAYLRGDFAAAIAVWDRCRDMLRQLYDVTPSRATQALGAEILQAARAGTGRAVAAAAPAIPLFILRPPRLIGRARELEALLHAWHGGQTVCVSGEAGIGKSRLLAEFAAGLQACVSVASRAGDEVTPYASLTRLVAAAVDRFRPPLGGADARWAARLLPGIAYLVADAPAAPLQTEPERQLALGGVRALLAACATRGCAAFVLDDLQFADRASLDALLAIIGEPADLQAEAAPRFALGSRFEDAGAPSSRLVAALDATRGFLRVELAPLAEAELAALLESLALSAERLAGPSRRLLAQAGGNPAFLLESLKLLISLGDGGGARGTSEAALPIPPGIEAIIQRRIALLGAPARHIAQLAAVAGSRFDLEMAAAALACPVFALSEPLQELERRQVLVGRQFVHDLVAGAARRSIPASVADFMHRFVAGQLGTRDDDPAAIADHWSACGEWARAGACQLRAAERALDALRPLEQAELLDAAIASFERAGDDEALFGAIVRRLENMEVADRTVVRSRLNERLGALARSEAQQVRVLFHRASHLSDHSQLDSLAMLEVGLARARALGPGEAALAFEFVEPLAQVLSAHGRFPEAVALIASFEPWVEAQADARLQGRVQRMLASTLVHGDQLARSVVHGRRAVALFRAAGDDLRALPTMSNLGLALHWRSELQAARTVMEEAVAVRDRLHGATARTMLDVNLAAVLRDLGEFSLADERLQAIAEAFRARLALSPDEPATDLAIAENHQAQLWLMLGQPERALAALAADDAAIDPRFQARRLGLRLRSARLQGQTTGALDAAAAVLIPRIGSPFHRAWFELEALRSKPAHEALAGFARVWAEPAVIERPGLQLHAGLRAAEAALATGDVAAAGWWLDACLPALAALPPFDFDADAAWSIAADVWRARGDAAEAAAEAAEEAERRAHAAIARRAAALPAIWRSAYLASRTLR